MSATYDPTLATDRDWCRFLVRDHDMAAPHFQDEEIDAVLVDEGDKYLAASRLGRALLGRVGGAIEKQVDDLRLKYSDEPETAYSTYLDGLYREGCRRVMPKPRVLHVL